MSRPGFESGVPEEDVHAPCECAHQNQMDRLELKLDELLAFRDVVLTTAAPLLSGKTKTWLALLAKTKGV